MSTITGVTATGTVTFTFWRDLDHQNFATRRKSDQHNLNGTANIAGSSASLTQQVN